MQNTGKLKHWRLVIWIVVIFAVLAGCQPLAGKDPVQALDQGTTAGQPANETGGSKVPVVKGQAYSTMAEVAAYIHEFRSLPPNFITKAEAQKLGWDNAKGNLWAVTDHKSIGGDRFGNREGLLPKAAGRQYYECDINYYGGYRGAERIVYSNDGLVFSRRITTQTSSSFTRRQQMKEIRLNGAVMVNKAAAHVYLKRKLTLPEHYGNNLDALWDCLSTDFSPKTITISHPEAIIKNLGSYGEALIQLFLDAAAGNEFIQVKIE